MFPILQFKELHSFRNIALISILRLRNPWELSISAIHSYLFTRFIYLNQFLGVNEGLEHCIKHYFNQGLAYFEILLFLQRYHHTAISSSTLLRRLKGSGVLRRTNLNIANNFVQETSVDGSGSSSGNRSVWHLLQLEGFCVPRSLVQSILKDIDPERTDSRSRHRPRRSIYRNSCANYAWHIDGHDKLKPFGFAMHGAIDDWFFGWESYVRIIHQV